MTAPGPLYADVRTLWLWWVLEGADLVAGLRAAAACLAAQPKGLEQALDLLKRAEAVAADGPDAVPAGAALTQDEQRRAYAELTGVDPLDAEGRGRIAAAVAAHDRAEREAAEKKAVVAETTNARADRAARRRAASRRNG